MLWFAAGNYCYKGPLPATPGVNMTFTMSAWSHALWTGTVWNGATAGTAVVKGTLTPGSPSLVVTLTAEPTWWVSIVTPAFGTAFIQVT